MNKIEKETIERYDEIAEEYNRDWRGKHDETQLKHLKKFMEMMGSPPKRILDAGCGTGKDCIYLASHEYEVYGVDLSHGMLKQAIANSKTQNLKINFSVGDIKSLVFPSNYFDGIWTNAVLVHLSPRGKQKAIREFCRVLKSKGFLYISVQNLLSPKHIMRLIQSYLFYLERKNDKVIIRRKSILEIKKGKSLKERIKLGYAYLDSRHWFYPTKRSLLHLLREEGFSIIETNSLVSRRLSIYAQKI